MREVALYEAEKARKAALSPERARKEGKMQKQVDDAEFAKLQAEGLTTEEIYVHKGFGKRPINNRRAAVYTALHHIYHPGIIPLNQI